ncbi:MAG TPA: type II toxin-antitoxin system VapC family toxin [Pseudonocardiaceae bacterium]|nr:type II toxin-antitoxin system VapC family toxin [Pseudonocardiaceae bacterium]
MIVLDTNVISELAQPEPAPEVVDWVDKQDAEQIFVTSVTIGELLYSLVHMPAGKRRASLLERLSPLLDDLFDGQSLEYTGRAAVEYAKLVASRHQRGRPITTSDAQIAAICRVHGADLATRNVRDFVETGVQVINPWTNVI